MSVRRSADHTSLSILLEVQRSLVKAQRDFKTACVERTRKVAEDCRRTLCRLAKYLSSNANLKTHLDALHNNVNGLLNRVEIAESSSSRYIPFERAGCIWKFDQPFTRKQFENVRSVLSDSGLDCEVDLRYEDTASPKIWFPYAKWEIYHYLSTHPSLKSQLTAHVIRSLDDKSYSVDRYLQKQQSLLQEAQAFFLRHRTPKPVQCLLSKRSQTSDPEMIDEILVRQNFPGMSIGESHKQLSAMQFLIDNLEEFAVAGVNKIYSEQFFYDTMQPHLDAYFASNNDEMSPILHAFIQAKDTLLRYRSPYTFMDLVTRAKKAGIRIIGIDTSLGHGSVDALRKKQRPFTTERAKIFNYGAYKIIQQYAGEKGKFLIWTGGSHGPTVKLSDETTVPGLSDLFGIPYILFKDYNESQAYDNLSNFPVPLDDGSAFEFLHVHRYILRKIPTDHDSTSTNITQISKSTRTHSPGHSKSPARLQERPFRQVAESR